MPELGALREAEEYAGKIVDQAQKDAQKTLLGTPIALEEMNREKEARLAAIAAQAQAAVDAEMRDLEARLEGETGIRLAAIEARRSAIEEEALVLLRERILRGGTGG